MQSFDAPFQTGSASHSPLHAAPSPSSPAFPDATTATASSSSSLHHHHPPSGTRMNRLSRSYSGSHSPATPLASPYIPRPAAAANAHPDREDASASPALSRHGSGSTASDLHTAMSRGNSSNGAPPRVDKGKGVVREGPVGQGDAQDDPDEQQRRVERVLQRAEASRLARAFRNRLALASYKASRGWHDVGLDTIEPHLEQEAQRRSQGPVAAANAPPPPPPQHYPSQPLAHEQYAPQHRQPVYQQQQNEPTPQYDMDAVLGAPASSSHPHKRTRLDDPYQPARSRPPPQQHQQQADMYSAHSVYAPPPQPVHTVSPYSTASVYHREPAGPSSSSRGQFAASPDAVAPSAPPAAAARKQRATTTAGAASPSSPAGSSRTRRVPSRRSSPAKGGSSSRPGDALSSSDPTFSSFVDAATALTGMARAPSDPSSQGSGSDEGGGAGGGTRSAAGRGMDVDGHGQGQRAGEASEVGGGGGDGARAPFDRPATPERQIVKLDGAPIGLGAPGGGSAGANDSGTAEGAAELMLYLAASPSPVQSRKAPPTTLGDGSGIKGRRLFSGMGMGGGDDASAAAGGGSGQDPGSIFGGELGGAHPGPLDAPFATSSSAPTSSSTAPTSAPLEPVKSGGATSTGTGVFGGGPATPGRQRQPSLGGAASWELFINASPSPKRGGPNGGAGAAAGAGMGSTRGASPPHAAIGA
ncbi:hypothetical protein JCM8208_003624 [Rhodotorula glutinis]